MAILNCNIKDFTLRKLVALFYYLTSCLFISCESNPHDVDLSGVTTDQQLKRFEQELFSPGLEAFCKTAPQKYGSFYNHFVEDIISVGSAGSPNIPEQLQRFTTDPDISKIKKHCDKEFESFEDEFGQISLAFRYYKYHFPGKTVPGIITFISGFNYAIVATDSAIGVGLDMFLGPGYEFYQHLRFPKYKRDQLKRQNIPYQVMQGWIETEFPYEVDKPTMLAKMVYEGKLLYLMDAFFPGHPDSLKIGYTPVNMQWARDNELQVWAHFVDEQLLYKTVMGDYFKFFNDAPFTSAFSKQSAPRAGEFMGWQLVRSFMRENEKITLDSLMGINDAQFILKASKYKPGR